MRRRVIISILLIGAVVGGATWWTALRKATSQLPSQSVKNVLQQPSHPKLTAKVISATRTKAKESEAPASIRPILDAQRDFAERFQAARKLGKKLSHRELTSLYKFLREDQGEADAAAVHALKSDVMDALCNQAIFPKDLAQLFVDIFNDRTQDVVIRDYALQHAPDTYARLQKVGWPQSEKIQQQAEVAELLWSSLSETDSSIAGTGILGLCRVADSSTTIDKQQIAAAALKLAGDSTANDLARTTALQVCGRLGANDALPLISQIAEHSTDVPLRISSIAALGLIGGQKEINVLQQIAMNEDARLKPATLVALQRLQARVASQ